VVTICTASFNIQQFYVLPTWCTYLCVLCGSQNKQRLFPYTALTDWFVWEWVFTARYGLGLYIQLRSILDAHTGSSPRTNFSPVSVTTPMLHTQLQLPAALSRYTNRRLGTFNSAMPVQQSGSIRQLRSCTRCYSRSWAKLVPKINRCSPKMNITFYDLTQPALPTSPKHRCTLPQCTFHHRSFFTSQPPLPPPSS
jgi:hypothetical protein